MEFELGEQMDLSQSPPKGKSDNTGDEGMIKMISADIFGAGLETVSNALCWAMAYIVNNPKTQQDLQGELDSAVGRQRLPKIQDKPNMPLLQATVLEVLLISSVLPIALPHQTSEDTTLGEYKIPRDSLVVVNLWAVNHDPRTSEIHMSSILIASSMRTEMSAKRRPSSSCLSQLAANAVLAAPLLKRSCFCF